MTPRLGANGEKHVQSHLHRAIARSQIAAAIARRPTCRVARRRRGDAARAAVDGGCRCGHAGQGARRTAVYNWAGCYVGLNGGGAASASNFTTGVGIGTHLTTGKCRLGRTWAGPGRCQQRQFPHRRPGRLQLAVGAGSSTALKAMLDYFHGRSADSTTRQTTLSDGVTPFTSLPVADDQLLRDRACAPRRRRRPQPRSTSPAARFHQGELHRRPTCRRSRPGRRGQRSPARNRWWVGPPAPAGNTPGPINWTIKAEYLFAMLPAPPTVRSARSPTPRGGINPLHGSADLVIQTARAGANYKF
jgi:hypothetical protein